MSKNVKIFLFFILPIICLLETGCAKPLYQYSAPLEAKDYPVLQYTLIELIKALPKPMPTTMDKAQALFNNQLQFESKNESFSFYIGGPFITKDGVVVTSVDVRVRNNSNVGVETINFDIDQRQCVSTELLKKKFGFYVYSFNSPHPVKHPKISYDAGLSWGVFAVGATSDNEECATGVGVYK